MGDLPGPVPLVAGNEERGKRLEVAELLTVSRHSVGGVSTVRVQRCSINSLGIIVNRCVSMHKLCMVAVGGYAWVGGRRLVDK